MRLLDGLQHHRDVIDPATLPIMGESSARQRLAQDRKGLDECLLGCFIVRILAETPTFQWGNTAAHAKFKPPPAQLVEHAYFLGEPQRVIKRQAVDHGAKAQTPGALRH